MTTSNDEFKDFISGVFTRASADYDHIGPKFFALVGRKLVEFAQMAEGAQVLDLACGRGAVLFPAATSISSSGNVTGIDISEGMIRLIEKEISDRGIENATAVVMDAEKLEFKDATFDYVLCGLGLFFFPDLEKSLAETMRVLKPGGFLAASTFENPDDEIAKRWERLNAMFKDHLAPAPGPSTNTFDLDNEDEIRDVLARAGFVNIEIAKDQQALDFDDEGEWWQWMWSHGFRGFLERLDGEFLDDYKEQAVKLFMDHADTWYLIYSKAQKP